MHAYLGVSPIAWSNDDLPELGGSTTLETCLSDAREAGYIGIETGGKFPKSPDTLRDTLSSHKLNLCGGWYSGSLLDTELEVEKTRILEQMHLFKALKAPCLVYGETARSIQTSRHTPLDRRVQLSEEDIKSYARKITQFAEWCHEQGMPIVFHHHVGTVIESERDLDLLMRYSGEALGLLVDPGHLVFGQGDVFLMIDRYGHRIKHVHTKDVRLHVLQGLDRLHDSFLNAVLKGVFTVPGDGDCNYDKIIQALADKGYEGWFVVEAEQDPEKAPPLDYARNGYNRIRKSLEKAGYTIMERPNESS